MQVSHCCWSSYIADVKALGMIDRPANSTPPTRNFERLALAALVAGALAIGFSGILARISETGPSATGFWRTGAVVPIFWGWLWWQNRSGRTALATPREPLSGHDRRILILAGLFFGIDIAFWHWSVQFTTIANANLLSNLNPVVVALASVFLFGERLGQRFYIGLGLALVGAAILSGASFGANMETSASFGAAAGSFDSNTIAAGSFDSKTVMSERVKGDILAVITAVFYGAYLVTVGRLRDRLDTVTIMAWSSSVAAAFLLLVAWISGEVLLPATLEGWAIVLGLAFSAQLFGQSLIAYAFAHLPAAYGALTLLIQPIVATIAAWILLGEHLIGVEILGAGVILTGILISRLTVQSK